MAHIPTWTLGERMWKARKDAGLSSTAMADQLGVSSNTIGNYEAGRTTPSLATLKLWSEVTNVPLSWLADDIEVRRRRKAVTARVSASATDRYRLPRGRATRRRRGPAVTGPTRRAA